ncbi:MAG: MATE family efflux transporter [Thermomicrobiales bacterium]
MSLLTGLSRWLGLGHDETDDPDTLMRRKVMRLAWPAVIQGLLMTSIQVVDTFLVSLLSDDALAAVGTASQLIFVMFVALIAIEIGASVLVAQSVGAGDRETAGIVARQSITLGLLLAIPVSLLGWLLRHQLIGAFGLDPEVRKLGVEYWSVVSLAIFVVMLVFVLSGILQGSGDTATPMWGTAVATVTNSLFAYLLIFGKWGFPELGVAGSAWGSVIGWSTEVVFLVAMIGRGSRPFTFFRRSGWWPSMETTRGIFRVGGPTAIEDLAISTGLAVHTGIVAVLGTASLAAHRIVFNALNLSFMPGFGLAIAATALVGQAIGARDPASGRLATRISAQFAVLWMGSMGLIYFALAGPIAGIFTGDADVRSIGASSMQALATSQVFWGMLFVFSGALRGTGKSLYPAIVNAIMIWAAVGLSFGLVEYGGYGLASTWLAYLPAAGIAVYFLWRRVRSETLLDESRGDARNWALLIDPEPVGRQDQEAGIVVEAAGSEREPVGSVVRD